MSDADLSNLGRVTLFKGVTMPKTDAIATSLAKVSTLGDNLTKFNSYFDTSAKLNSLAFNSAQFNTVDAFDVKALTNRFDTTFADYTQHWVKDIQRSVSSLTAGQKGWLAKGVRDWSAYVSSSLAHQVVELKPHPDFQVFDLKTYLHRRQLRGIRRRAGWALLRKGIAVRDWLWGLGERTISRLAACARGESGPKLLLALLKAPPGWTRAIGARRALEAALPRIVEQIAEVSSPNAPSPSPGHLPLPGGSVLFT
jgi:hypothetical protein